MSSIKKSKERAGRPARSKSSGRKLIAIKLTDDEYKEVLKLAKECKGNINKLFRVKILGESNGS